MTMAFETIEHGWIRRLLNNIIVETSELLTIETSNN